MFTTAAAVAEHTVLISQVLPQKDTALFGVVSLNKSHKVHNQKQLECRCNLGENPCSAKTTVQLAHNLARNYTLINV
jgi:hypothetical protein